MFGCPIDQSVDSVGCTDLRRVGTSLSKIGIEIEEKMLIEHDKLQAYAPFGPQEDSSDDPF